MNNGTHRIVRIVLLNEPTQDPRWPHPSPVRGHHKGSVECPGQLGTLASAVTTANGGSASSICPDWRYTLPSAARRWCSMTTVFVAEWREAREAP